MLKRTINISIFIVFLIIGGMVLPFVGFPLVKTAHAAIPELESGSEDIDDSLEWTSVTLSNTYSTAPVILVTPVTSVNCAGTCSGTGSGNGGMYPVPLIRNVTTTGFDISMCIDGGNANCSTGQSTETFHWFAFDVDDAESYDWIEAGTTASVATNGTTTSETYTTSFEAVPHVWTQAQTYSQSGEIGAHAWVIDGATKTTSGFNYIGCVHTGTANVCDSDNPAETFGYVAIDVTNEAFDSAYDFQTGMKDISNSAWTAVTFSSPYTTPRVMVTQNDDDGGQDPEYAWAQSVTTTGMNIRYCEEDAGDLCNTHNSEKMYWFTIEQPVSVSPTYTQNDFEWFVTANSVTLTNAWPPGGGEDLTENTALTQIPGTNRPLASGDQIRIQMNFTVAAATLAASTQAFKLQYDAAEDCTVASGWTDVGAKASGTIWRLFDETGIGDSTTQVNDISTSTSSAEGYYSEINASAVNPNEVLVTENSEWDWPIENNGAAENTTYCFRMVLSDATEFGTYNADGYPKLTTAPGMSNLMRHGNFFQNSVERGFFWAD